MRRGVRAKSAPAVGMVGLQKRGGAAGGEMEQDAGRDIDEIGLAVAMKPSPLMSVSGALIPA